MFLQSLVAKIEKYFLKALFFFSFLFFWQITPLAFILLWISLFL